MKRFVTATVAVVAIVLALAGCGSSAKSATTTSSKPAAVHTQFGTVYVVGEPSSQTTSASAAATPGAGPQYGAPLYHQNDDGSSVILWYYYVYTNPYTSPPVSASSPVLSGGTWQQGSAPAASVPRTETGKMVQADEKEGEPEAVIDEANQPAGSLTVDENTTADEAQAAAAAINPVGGPADNPNGDAVNGDQNGVQDGNQPAGGDQPADGGPAADPGDGGGFDSGG